MKSSNYLQLPIYRTKRPLFLMKLFILSLFLTVSSQTAFADIPLMVKETQGMNRANEMVHNGIPVSREESLYSTSTLIIEDSEGKQIPATFEVLSRWSGGITDSSKPIQWLLVSFPVTINANSTSIYTLKSGTPIARVAKISILEDSNTLTINTGAAEFAINKSNMTLFERIANSSATILSGNGSSSATIQGQSAAAANPPQISIERSNDHYLCVKAEGTYKNTPVGSHSSQPLHYKLRYEFFSGSATAVCYVKFYWPGYGNGFVSAGILVDNVSLLLPDFTNYASTEVYADASTYLSGELSATQTASIAQKLRTSFSNPHAADVKLGSATKSVQFASRPMLLNRSNAGVIAVSIDHMDKFEPQSIVTNSNGKITVNILSENQHFADCQGTWARLGISALSSNATYAESLEKNYAPLNHRLFAFPMVSYVKDSGVYFELPSSPGTSSITEVQSYYSALQAVTTSTKQFLRDEKFHGLMTWGGLVRYPGEVGSGDSWDKLYNSGTFADYHNAWNGVGFHFLYEQDPTLLYDYSFMGARRMLHTQIIQPDSSDSSTKMAWGYAGYGRYRTDANSSHSYFENLYNYYYLTGDMETIDVLKLAGSKMRLRYTRSNDGNLNDQSVPGGLTYTDRVGFQQSTIFNFLGHTYDASFLDDFKHMHNHAFSHSLVLLKDSSNQEYCFVTDANQAASPLRTSQPWLQALYYMHGLYMLYHEYGDITLGSSNLRISRVYSAIAKYYTEYVAKIDSSADGTWGSRWVNGVSVSYSGDRIGGTITSVSSASSSSSYLYTAGMSCITTMFLRAGKMTGDANFTNFGKAGVDYVLNTGDFQRTLSEPWGKVSGEMYNRLHHALGYFESSGGNENPVIYAFNATPTSAEVNTGITFEAYAADPNGDTLTFHIDFGDGSSTDGDNVTHAYSSVGEYNATLAVSNTKGLSASVVILISIGAEPQTPQEPETIEISF